MTTKAQPPAAAPGPITAAPLDEEAAKHARLAELDRLIADQEARFVDLAKKPLSYDATPVSVRLAEPIPESASIEYVERLARDQEEALRQFNRDIGHIESHQLSEWRGMPPEFQPPRAHYFRCGLRGPGKEGQRTAQLAREMRAAGWKDAPRGTYCKLWQSDGDDGVYLFMMDSAWKVHKEIQHQLNAEAQRRNEGRRSQAAQDVMAVRGLHIERFDIETRQGSHDDFDADTRGMRR